MTRAPSTDGVATSEAPTSEGRATTEAAETTAAVATTAAAPATTAGADDDAAAETAAPAATAAAGGTRSRRRRVTTRRCSPVSRRADPAPAAARRPTVDLVLAGYELDDGFLATARGQYPDGYVLDVPVALQGAQDQALANVGGELISSQDITLQGRPGREFSATLTSGGESGTLLQRVYLDGLVIYQQLFTGAGETTFTDPEVAPFFESFAFTTG